MAFKGRAAVAGFAAACAVATLLATRPAAQAPEADAVLNEFLGASSRAEAVRIVDRIVRTGVSFDEAYRRLRRGRSYGAQATGLVRLKNRTSDGVEHHFVLNVPESYDPARRYQVRIHLHGGVAGRADNTPVGPGTIGALAGVEQIYVIPYAWADAPWFEPDESWLRPALAALVDHVKGGRGRRLAVERFDGVPVTESELLPLLVEAGFLAGPRRAILRP